MRDGTGIGRSIVADEPVPTIVRSAPDVPLTGIFILAARVSTLIHPSLSERPDFFVARSSASQSPSAQAASMWNRLDSAEDWDDLLVPEIERQQAEGKRVVFRAGDPPG